MALKAYKHLADGEVKIVEAGSAEETSLLADTVKGASYLQMTSSGHAQEVAAAQGTALWIDVTSDLGGGGGLPTGMDYQVFEVTDLVIPSGTDWSVDPYVLCPDTPLSPPNAGILQSLSFEIADVPPVGVGLVLTGVASSLSLGDGSTDPTGRWIYETTAGTVHGPGSGALSNLIFAYLQTNGPTTEDITIVSARAAFLIF